MESAMTDRGIRHVLVPVDFSEASAAALQAGAAIARRFGARLTLLHIEIASSVFVEALAGTETPADLEAAIERHRDALQDRSDAFARRALADDLEFQAVVLDSNFVGETIVRYAEDHDVDWICMGATGHRAIERLVLGDVAAEVLHHTHVPVLTMRARKNRGADLGLASLLVAVDLSEGSRELVESAAALVQPGGRLTLMHVVEGGEARGLYSVPLEVPVENMNAVVEWCDVALRQLAEQCGVDAADSPRVVVGRPGASILAVEKELQPDVTVVGTHGRHGMERLMLGSVAERVARRATGPVMRA